MRESVRVNPPSYPTREKQTNKSTGDILCVFSQTTTTTILAKGQYLPVQSLYSRKVVQYQTNDM